MLSVARNFCDLEKKKVVGMQLAYWVILDEYSCHGEVQPVHSVSASDIGALKSSGTPYGKKSYLTLREGPQLHHDAFCFNFNE